MEARSVGSGGQRPTPPPPRPPRSPTTAARQQQVERMAARLEAQYPDVRHVRPEDVYGDGGGGGGGKTGRCRRQQLVDTRTAAERQVSVLPGAIPLSELEKRLAADDVGQEHAEDTEFILYCTIGKRSSDEARRLARRHPALAFANLRGSVLAWVHAGYPLDGASKKVHCYAKPWALLPEDDEFETVLFSPWELLVATVARKRG